MAQCVALSGGGSAVWILEVRTLNLPPNTPSQLHANLDFRARGMRSVKEWSLTTYALPERDEAVVQLAIRRRTAALRPDNVFLAWSRVMSGLFKLLMDAHAAAFVGDGGLAAWQKLLAELRLSPHLDR